MPQPLRLGLTTFLWLALLGLAGATAAALIGRVHWFFDLFTHFPLQISATLIAVGGMAALLRRWRALVVTAALLAPNLFALSYYYPARSFSEEQPDLRVVCFNVLTSNRAFDPVRNYLQDTNADCILLMETDRQWITALAPLEATYPYVLKAPRGDNFGMALYSKHQIDSHRFLKVDGSGVPCLQALIEVDGQLLELICGHPVPPVGALRAESRNAYLHALADLCAETNHPTVVLGDLNATIWSPHFREFLESTRLHDTGYKRGFQSTWHRSHPLFSIPIDHILHSADLVCTNRTIGPPLGSDHRPVMAELRFER